MSQKYVEEKLTKNMKQFAFVSKLADFLWYIKGKKKLGENMIEVVAGIIYKDDKFLIAKEICVKVNTKENYWNLFPVIYIYFFLWYNNNISQKVRLLLWKTTTTIPTTIPTSLYSGSATKNS